MRTPKASRTQHQAETKRSLTAVTQEFVTRCRLVQEPADLNDVMADADDSLELERLFLAFRVQVATEYLNGRALQEFLKTADSVFDDADREMVIQRAAYLIGIEVGRRLAGGAR